MSGQFSSVTAVRFSPIRPLIFAAATIDGFLYVFDLSRSSSAPLYVVEALMNPVIPTSKTSNNAGTFECSNELIRYAGVLFESFYKVFYYVLLINVCIYVTIGSSEESNTTQSQSSPSALPAFVSKRQQRHLSGNYVICTICTMRLFLIINLG